MGTRHVNETVFALLNPLKVVFSLKLRGITGRIRHQAISLLSRKSRTADEIVSGYRLENP
jgi:hypothetical protein